MKLKIILAFVLLSALGMLSAESWTVLVYMAADNNLAQMGALDINSMESATQPSGLNIIVQADFPEGAKRYKIQPDNSDNISSPVLSNLGAIDSGDPDNLNTFIKWGFSHYPSQRKMLVIWSHGDSWYKDGDNKWICPDYSSENLMSIAGGDLNRAFEGIPKLDILLFDACSMQSIEVITQVAEHASYIIGSEELVPQYGFPYERIIPIMNGDLDSILNQIPQLYVQSYLPGEGINPGPGTWTITCSTIATEALDSFRNAFQEAVQQMLLEGTLYHVLREDLYEFGTGLADIDIKQFATLLHEYRPSWPVFINLLSTWNCIVVASDFTTYDTGIENIGTAALWYPDNRFNFENGWPQYIKLDFAQNWWIGYVNYVLGDTEPPPAPVLLSQKVQGKNLILKIGLQPIPDFFYIEVMLNNDGIPRLYSSARYASSQEISIPIISSGTYTLKLVDFSGNVSAAISGSYELPSYIQVNPNPIRGKNIAALRWWLESTEAEKAKLEIYNIRGQKVMDAELGDISGEGMALLSAKPGFTKLAAGIYFLRLSVGRTKLTTKMTILY